MVSLLFCGDFAPVGRFEKLVIKKGSFIFGKLQKEINDADISFINLEVPACNVNSPVLKSGPNMRVNPQCLESVSKTGFDVIGLANNHILDHGEEGFLETLNNCHKYNLNYTGAGKNLKDAQKPIFINKEGVKVAIIAIAEHEFCLAGKSTGGAAPLDPIDNTQQIEEAKNNADFVFMTIHGGNEYFPYPRPGLRKICQYFIERGADGIICHHSHVPGAYEFYKDKPIVYGLGNIIFDQPNPLPGWCEGYAVRIEVNNKTKELVKLDIIPYYQSVEYEGVKLLNGYEEKKFIKKIHEYKSTMSDPVKYEKEWDNFCVIKENPMLKLQFLPNNPFFGVISKILPLEQLFISKNSISTKLNLTRCESHQELLQSILENKYNRYKD